MSPLSLDTPLSRHAGIGIPLICGAMYPCSNPELVAAVSDAGGIGIVQPISLTYVHGHDFRAGLQLIRRLTPRPVGMNALIEQSSRSYHERMTRWIDVALEEGVRFFVTSLGNPRWVVERVGLATAAFRTTPCRGSPQICWRTKSTSWMQSLRLNDQMLNPLNTTGGDSSPW